MIMLFDISMLFDFIDQSCRDVGTREYLWLTQ